MNRKRTQQRPVRRGITRRQALGKIGAAAGAAALAPVISACGSDGEPAGGRSQPSTPRVLRPSELRTDTVVIVMMENRSFDHYFGARSLLEGRPVDGLRAGFSNPLPDGTPVPIFPMGERCVEDPPHSWDASHRQVNDGLCDGYVREHFRRVGAEHADQVMGYHQRHQLPILYALADEFTLCERWFCSVRGPTWPNRMYLHAAQSLGRTNNAFPAPPGFRFPTIYDVLGAAGVEWKYYYSDLPFLSLWASLSQAVDRLQPVQAFFEDARAGTLPAVTVVDPAFGRNDDHPPHDIRRGQEFLSSIVHALGNSPQWRRSLLLLTYDEHGGFFDHVPPPTVEDERSAEGFGALGPRVPGLVISPWTKRGFVSPTLYEHSSVPALLGFLHGLEPLTVRDANANYFLDTFDIDRLDRNDPRPFPSLPVLEVDPDVPEECLQFPGAGGGGSVQDIEAYADSGGIDPHLDRRRQIPETLRAINQELVRLGAGRFAE
jgi:phospholipase C